jgi:Uma2 family endonuclease
MFMATETELAPWTRDDLARFPNDGNRYEVLDGELLVTPQANPDHQVVAARLIVQLYAYCESTRAGTVVGPAAVIFGRSELQPDVEVIPIYPLPSGKKWVEHPYPALAIEVLSPFSVSRNRDLDLKRHAYLRLGIADYWVIDTEKRCAHVWSPRGGAVQESIVTDMLRWAPRADLAPFEITIEQLLGPHTPA